VATLHFSGTDVKVFTPISSALANLPNGAGTIVVLVRQTTAAGDMAGLLDSTGSTWYHALGVHNAGNGNKLWDDDNTTILGITSQNTSLTDWKLFALDWGAVAGVESFHFRDQTTLGSWTHENSSVNNSVVAGPGTSGWFRIGYFLDIPIGAMDMAVVAVWAGTRFASGDYGSWTKTSDLYNHAKGPPTFLCELTATSPTDLIGGSTYSSGNSSGTALTGPNPDNWTFDGIGTTTVATPAALDPQIQWTDDFGPGDFGPYPFLDDSRFATGTPVAASTASTLRLLSSTGVGT
jgi:hypothetical protein